MIEADRLISANPRERAAQGFLQRALAQQGEQLRGISAPGRTDDKAAAAEIGCNGMTINWLDWLQDYARENAG